MAISVGLDIGQGSIKAVALKGRGATITLHRYATLSRQKLRDEGLDDEDGAGLAQQIALWLRSEGFPTTRLQVAVAGRDSIIRYSNLPPMPAWRLKLIMEYEIEEVASKAGESLTADYSIVPARSQEAGFSVLVALAKDVAIEPIISGLSENQLDIMSGSPAAVAVADTMRFLGDPETDGYSVVVNIGKTSTDVSVLDNGVLVFARTITSGGDLFTDAIADHYDLEVDEAEQCKLEQSGPDGRGIGPLVQPSMKRLGNLVRSTLNYMKGQLKLHEEVVPRRVFVAGGGAQLPTIARSLGDMMRCPAELWDPLAGIETAAAPAGDLKAIEDDGFKAAVACGLALKNLMPAATQLDLLPMALRKQREWKHRTRWLIAAAVVMLVQALLTLALTYHRYSNESDRRVTLQTVNGKTVKKRVTAHKKREDNNEARERYLAALSSHARSGRQVQRLLTLLSEVMPKNMIVVSIDMEVAKKKLNSSDDGLQTSAPISFRVTGQVDNSQLRCERQLAQLAEVMSQHESIKTVRIDPSSDTGSARVRFEIQITPKDPEG
jgi:type IV pilus assembly protein PilM